MKTVSFKLLLISCFTICLFFSCDNPGKEDHDGHKDLEGAADPANMGGKLGGSQSPLDRQKDSTKLFKLKLKNKENGQQK